MLDDSYGTPLSTASGDARSRFNIALRQIRTMHGDPIAALDASLEADPHFGLAWITRAIVLGQLTDRLFADEVTRSLRAASACALDQRERLHLGAALAWAEGRFHESASAFGRIAQDNPRDLLALQHAHNGCFFTGRQFDLRDWPLQAMRAWRPGDEGYHAVLGMAAFGLEECGDYARAEALGVEAVEFEPADAWAVHAVAHVHEMRGDTSKGQAWLKRTTPGWAEECGLGYHLWWHLALFHLDAQQHGEALALYDARIRSNDDANIALEMLDASALLWRLHLDGVDVTDRFCRLARVWEQKAEDQTYAFNDLHAVIAFVGAGRLKDAERVKEAMRRIAHQPGDNAVMTATVGLPLVEALIAFAEGRYAQAANTILNVRGIAQRFGGSHAQRDLLALTALHAAMRGGMHQTAEALASERLMHKPDSPWAARLAREARAAAAAAQAAE